MPQLAELLTTTEVADALRVSHESVRRWAVEGRLPCIELPSGQRRFRRDDIEALLAGNTTPPSEPTEIGAA